MTHGCEGAWLTLRCWKVLRRGLANTVVPVKRWTQHPIVVDRIARYCTVLLDFFTFLRYDHYVFLIHVQIDRLVWSGLWKVGCGNTSFRFTFLSNHMHTFEIICISYCNYIYIHTYIRTYIHTYKIIYIYVYIYICILCIPMLQWCVCVCAEGWQGPKTTCENAGYIWSLQQGGDRNAYDIGNLNLHFARHGWMGMVNRHMKWWMDR